MSNILLWVAVGAFLGWNFPQPFWAAWIQEKVKSVFNKETK